MNREVMDSLGDRIAEHAAHLDAATHRLLTDLREFDREGGWFLQGARSCAQWLSWRVGWDPGTAREHVRVAARLGDLPLIDDELRRGELSYSKVRAMTRVATPANEAVLLEEARHCTGAHLERICRKYAQVLRHEKDVGPRDDQERRRVTRHDTADGMVKIEALLHPEEAAVVWAALDRVATERCRMSSDAESHADRERALERDVHQVESGSEDVSAETLLATTDKAADPEIDRAMVSGDPETAYRKAPEQRASPPGFDRADALVSMAEDVIRGRRRNRSPVEISISVAAETLREEAVEADSAQGFGTDGCQELGDPGAVACYSDGTCISAHAARRLACDCGVVEVSEDERGVPLSVGRRARTIPGAMKRALLRRDRTCRFPGCTARVFLEGHHIAHWADGGETKLDNMVSLCSYHHRFVHEYGYSIETGSNNEPLFLDDLGRLVHDAPARPPSARRGWDIIRSRNDHLDITSDTPACNWDGMPVDYYLCVDALVRADGL